jgi:RluA family pseudouridine synthase
MKGAVLLKESSAGRPAGRAYTVDTPLGLLEFLLKTMTGLSRNSVKALLARGDVSVGGKRVTRHDYPLAAGQSVTIAPPGAGGRADLLKRLRVIYEDDELIAVDKPAGLLSIATENEKAETAYRLITDYVRLSSPGNRIFVVHRLDRDTSGVLLAAKNEKLKHALQDNWNELVKTRGYTAVAEGKFSEKHGTVRSFLKETATHFMYSGGRAGDGQEAVTNFDVTKESATYSQVKVTLDTGRKNQIRVHLSELGHPVAGDKKYGAKTDPLGRLCLHAGLLELTHPYSGKLLILKSDMPKSFMTLF